MKMMRYYSFFAEYSGDILRFIQKAPMNEVVLVYLHTPEKFTTNCVGVVRSQLSIDELYKIRKKMPLEEVELMHFYEIMYDMFPTEAYENPEFDPATYFKI